MSSADAAASGCGPLYHPMSNLLELSAQDILASYRQSQLADFTMAFRQLKTERANLASSVAILDRYLAAYPNEALRRQLDVAALEALFHEVHDHVMTHPVWVHPFFARFADGEISRDQLELFARHYFNQVKNTRQCVALALGRFHTLIDSKDGNLSNVLSELTQVVLAGLLADEYGVSTHPHRPFEPRAAGPAAIPPIDVGNLFTPVTHAALYRRFLESLGVPLTGYDIPALHGVADNVLIQRILAADPAFDHVEALASVGLGMEWGVPAFFSMIIAGVLKLTGRSNLPLDPSAMEIWSAHVQQDVEHAVAVMVATAFYVRGAPDVARIKNATNILMAFRYEMMSDIHEAVFGTACARIDEIGLDDRHLIADRRHEGPLAAARAALRASSIDRYERYLERAPLRAVVRA